MKELQGSKHTPLLYNIVRCNLNQLLQIYTYVVYKFINLATKFIDDRYPYNNQSYQAADTHTEHYTITEFRYYYIIRH